MRKTTLIILALLPMLAACGQTPIRKTNCWSGLSFVQADPSEKCEFQHVPAAR